MPCLSHAASIAIVGHVGNHCMLRWYPLHAASVAIACRIDSYCMLYWSPSHAASVGRNRMPDKTKLKCLNKILYIMLLSSQSSSHIRPIQRNTTCTYLLPTLRPVTTPPESLQFMLTDFLHVTLVPLHLFLPCQLLRWVSVAFRFCWHVQSASIYLFLPLARRTAFQFAHGALHS